MEEDNPPRYQHDCGACKYLGQWNEFDLYYCPQGGFPTIIARFGNEGSEYTSGLSVAHMYPELGEARRRAIDKGFLKI